MTKKIILCLDGTGNKGGQGDDTNVYKLYKALEIHDSQNQQVIFYDNGVGTSSSKILKAIGGAFGLGFSQNIKDTYEFLARYYEPGDQVFIFGFSRGAATARAFGGMLQICGLLDRKKCLLDDNHTNDRRFIDEDEFKKKIDKAFEAYESHRKDNSKKANEFKSNNAIDGEFPVKFIGVWDTVSALGFPQDWSKFINWFFKGLDKLTDLFCPHRFYNYQLNQNVENVYHALAIDDERETFHPKVWDENAEERPRNIEQVWFAGVHSNVGGGYPRCGVSDVALDWMLKKAQQHGLIFKTGYPAEVEKSANVFGELYDSRALLAIYYRYSPRNIEKLCINKKRGNKLKGPVKIHTSVFNRIKYGTDGYAPGLLPYEFEPVTGNASHGCKSAAEDEATWDKAQENVNKWISARKGLYRVCVEFTLLIIVIAGFLWFKPLLKWCENEAFDLLCSVNLHPLDGLLSPLYGSLEHIADILIYLVPEFFEELVRLMLIQNPSLFLIFLATGGGLYFLRKNLKKKTKAASEETRRLLLRKNKDWI